MEGSPLEGSPCVLHGLGDGPRRSSQPAAQAVDPTTGHADTSAAVRPRGQGQCIAVRTGVRRHLHEGDEGLHPARGRAQRHAPVVQRPQCAWPPHPAADAPADSQPHAGHRPHERAVAGLSLKAATRCRAPISRAVRRDRVARCGAMGNGYSTRLRGGSDRPRP